MYKRFLNKKAFQYISRFVPKCGVNKSTTNQLIPRNIRCNLHTAFTVKECVSKFENVPLNPTNCKIGFS